MFKKNDIIISENGKFVIKIISRGSSHYQLEVLKCEDKRWYKVKALLHPVLEKGFMKSTTAKVLYG